MLIRVFMAVRHGRLGLQARFAAELLAEAKRQVGEIVRQELRETLPNLVEPEILKGEYAVAHGVTAGAILDMAKVTACRGLRPIAPTPLLKARAVERAEWFMAMHSARPNVLIHVRRSTPSGLASLLATYE
jgi:hypothetical protein